MALLSWLLSPPNPTRDWPPHSKLPPFDISRQAFGHLCFGDNLESARRIGRPEKCNYRRSSSSWHLEYTSHGFRLTFTRDRLIDVFFEIGSGGEYSLRDGGPKAQPLLSSGERLTMHTRPDDIIRTFGPPDDTVESDEGTVLDYPSLPVALEFEFNTHGTLAVWRLFAD